MIQRFSAFILLVIVLLFAGAVSAQPDGAHKIGFKAGLLASKLNPEPFDYNTDYTFGIKFISPPVVSDFSVSAELLFKQKQWISTIVRTNTEIEPEFLKTKFIYTYLYQHEGGHTKNAATDGKWVSNPNDYNFVSSNIPVDGWETNYDHPLIFLASNSHASYFYGDPVYHFDFDPPGTLYDDEFTDEVDYDLSNVSIFSYDFLDKLGELKIKSPATAHGVQWVKHPEVAPNSKEWLGFPGGAGIGWGWSPSSIVDYGLTFVTQAYSILEIFGVDGVSPFAQTPSPVMPSYQDYYVFPNAPGGFGNGSHTYTTISFISIWP